MTDQLLRTHCPVSFVRVLLGADQSVNARDDDNGETILHVAARWGAAELAAYALRRGAKVNAT